MSPSEGSPSAVSGRFAVAHELAYSFPSLRADVDLDDDRSSFYAYGAPQPGVSIYGQSPKALATKAGVSTQFEASLSFCSAPPRREDTARVLIAR